MLDRILFCHGEGLGNVVQTVPVVRTLSQRFIVDYWHAFGTYKIPHIIPYIDNWFIGDEISKLNTENYLGAVKTHFPPSPPLPILAESPPLTFNRSEVDTYMDIARQLLIKPIWHGPIFGKPMSKEYDVILNNGYNPVGSANWKIKSYPYFDEIASELTKKDLVVAELGITKHPIPTTINKTNLSLRDSLSELAKANLFIGTDSGLYHCANALNIDNLVIFTATTTTKNYDPRFHKKAKIISKALPCQPCQDERRWNKDCDSWLCREIDPDYIIEEALKCV